MKPKVKRQFIYFSLWVLFLSRPNIFLAAQNVHSKKESSIKINNCNNYETVSNQLIEKYNKNFPLIYFSFTEQNNLFNIKGIDKNKENINEQYSVIENLSCEQLFTWADLKFTNYLKLQNDIAEDKPWLGYWQLGTLLSYNTENSFLVSEWGLSLGYSLQNEPWYFAGNIQYQQSNQLPDLKVLSPGLEYGYTFDVHKIKLILGLSSELLVGRLNNNTEYTFEQNLFVQSRFSIQDLQFLIPIKYRLNKMTVSYLNNNYSYPNLEIGIRLLL